MKKIKCSKIQIAVLLLFIVSIAGIDYGLTAGPTIYTVGYYKGRPSYWMGTTLTSPSFPVGANGGEARAITVKDGTVYTAGFCGMTKGDIAEIACFWKGITPTVLPFPPSARSGWANGLFIDEETVYSAGEYVMKDRLGYTPCYWVEKTITSLVLPSGGVFGTANSIFVKNGIVYVSGTFAKKLDGSQPVDEMPCYWKGKTLTPLPLPPGVKSGKTTSIFVTDDGTTYISGFIYQRWKYIPCYWRGQNLILLDLPPGGSCGVAKSIIVSEGKVYNAGYFGKSTDEDGYPDNETPCYWIGNKPTILLLRNNSLVAGANSITVHNGTVYVAGYQFGKKNSAVYFPCYWEGSNSPAISLVPLWSGVGNTFGIAVE